MKHCTEKHAGRQVDIQYYNTVDYYVVHAVPDLQRRGVLSTSSKGCRPDHLSLSHTGVVLEEHL